MQPTEACALTLRWTPLRNAAVIDNVQIVHDGARGVFVMPVSGEADIEALSQPVQTSDNIDVEESEDTAEETDEEPVEEEDTSEQTELDNIINNQLGGNVALPNVSVPSAPTTSVLEGYRISSMSPTKATLNGANGSRIVADGSKARIGGIIWDVSIENNTVIFRHKKQKATLYFDSNLSIQNSTPILEQESVSDSQGDE